MAHLNAGICGPPGAMRTGETPYWQDTPYIDKFNNAFDSGKYTLTYNFAGASAKPVQLVAVAQAVGMSAQGWQTTFDPVNSALMLPGLYKWQAVLTGTPVNFTGTIAGTTLTVNTPPAVGVLSIGAVLTGAGVTVGTTLVSGGPLSWVVAPSQSVGPVSMTGTLPTRLVASEGDIIVEQDLSLVQGTFDGRTQMQIGLANAEAALLVFQSSGGRIKSYNIAGRSMTFQDDKEIRDLCQWFRARVNAERDRAAGGDQRMIRIGFSPPTSGVPASSSRNWPWW